MTSAARKFDSLDTQEQRKPELTLAQADSRDTLRNCVRRSLNDFFRNLDGEDVSELYDTVLAEMEIPLLEKVLEYTRGNQTRAAEMLGLNRGTLRKKLKQYGLL
ncbi:MAG: DNA-binding transcriptional regulator Fis [Alcanivoracaceae bacterium]|jgi:Fis family transcriptional regulator|nr:DNA-binding transcriptional regulator Fis [Alcanivoracaceae bacterium]